MKKIFFLSLIALLFLNADVIAGKRYWIATTTANWSSGTTNWSTSSAGSGGATVPGVNDTAYFDGNRNGNCTINVGVDVKRLEIVSAYSGTITQGANIIKIGTGNAVLSSGTFTGGTVAIRIAGSLTISGTAFTSTSDTLAIVGNLSRSSGSFSSNSGTVLFTTSNTITHTFTFNNLAFRPAAAAIHDIINTLTVNGTLTLSGSNKLTLNTGTIDAKNGITISNTGTGGGGTALVSFTGTGTAAITSSSSVGQGALPRVTINKTGGIGPGVSLSGTISVANDWTYTAGTVTYGSSTVAFVDTLTIGGPNHQLNNVTFQSTADAIYTIGSSTTLTVNGTLATGGSGKLTFNTSGSGVIDAKSHVTLSNTGTGGGGTALITMTGAGSVNLTGNTAVGRSALPKFQINRTGTGAAITITDTVSAGNNWTWTAGPLTTTNSHVAFMNSCTIAGTHTLNIVTFSSSSAAMYIISNTLTVNGILSTRGSGALTFNTGTIDAKSTIKLLNTGTGGGGDATITITGSSNVTMYGNSTVGQSALPKLTINKSVGGTLTLSGVISAANNWTRTAGDATPGSSTVAFISALTITGVDTLNNVTFFSNSGSPVAYTLATSAVLRVGGALLFDGSATVYFNTTSGGRIDALGNITIANTGTAGGIAPGQTGATLKLIGTGTVNFDSNVSSGKGMLPHVTIDKTGGTVTLLDTISIGGNWECLVGPDAYLDEGTSTVYFTGSKTITGNHTLNNVFVDGGTYTMSTFDTTRVTGLLKYVGSTSITINTGTFIAQGNITLANTGTAGGGSGLIFIRGTAVQTFTGVASVSNNSLLPNIHIKKSGGSVTLAQVLPVRGNWTYTSGNTIHGTSTVGFTTTKTIAGSDTLYNVLFAGAAATFTIQTGTTLYTAGTLSTQGSNALTINNGTIKALGDISLGNTSTSTGGSATVLIGGSVAQLLTGSGTAGGGALPNVTITKSSGTLTLSSIITCAGNWIYTAGTVAPGMSTVAFAGTYNLDGYEGSAAMPFYNVLIYSGTRTLTDHIDVNNNLTINGSATLNGSSKTINVGGDWINSGTFTSSTSTVVFDGVKYNALSRPGAVESFYNLTFKRAYDAGVKKSVTLGSRVDVTNALTMTRGRVKTTSTFYLRLTDNATCSGGSDTAYVDGPMRKLGNEAFTFPLGDTVFADTASYHPLGITAPSSASDEFEGEYYGVNQAAGDSLVDSLATISDQEYWRLDRKVGSSTVYTTLAWNKNSTYVQNYNTLRVANWNNVKWLDLGGTGVTISGRTGTVTAVAAPTYVSNSALLTLSSQVNPETYAVLHRKLDGGYYVVRNGALYFMYDEEYNDTDDELTFTIYDQQRRVIATNTGAYAISKQSDYGDNRFYINLFDCSINLNGSVGAGVYILEVTNEKNEKWFLRFKHVTTITPNCPGSGGGPE